MMRAFLFLILCSFTLVRAAPVQFAPVREIRPVTFDLKAVSISEALALFYRTQVRRPYIFAPEVLKDLRQVTFRTSSVDVPVDTFLAAFLDQFGYEVERVDGVDMVRNKRAELKEAEALTVLTYQPRFRDTAYLMRLTASFFTGNFSTSRAVPSSAPLVDAPQGSASSQIQQASDVLVFRGLPREVGQLRDLLMRLDTPVDTLSVKAIVYETRTLKSEGSAFKVLASLLSGKLGLVIEPGAVLPNQLILKSFGIDAIISAVSGDSRFRAISQPSLLVRSGDTARLIVGQDVPVLGAVTFVQGGTPVRSVDYKQSGTILSVTPTSYGGAIDVRVDQQITGVVPTDTGVNDSPTITRRQMQTSLTTQSGQVVVLGGLNEKLTSDNKRSLFFLPLSKQADDTESEILILLQVDRAAGLLGHPL